jgi:hypothetical protein
MTSESSSCCCSGNATETQDADLLYCFLEIVGGWLYTHIYTNPPTHHQELMKSAVGSCGSLSLLFMMVVVMI